MKKILILLVFSASMYSMQTSFEVEVKVLFDPLARMEMGMARPGHEPRSDIEACCDCTLNPDQYIRIAAQTVPLVYLVDTTFNSFQQTNPTAFLPMIYASVMVFNSASIVRTAWKGFRESKFKEKED